VTPVATSSLAAKFQIEGVEIQIRNRANVMSHTISEDADLLPAGLPLKSPNDKPPADEAGGYGEFARTKPARSLIAS
jgi:hypothetical protein